MSILALTSNTLVTAASGQIEYDGQFFATDSAASRAQLQRIVRATAVSASGTSVDFTGIPAWVERITVMFSGISTTGLNPYIVQIGSGSVSSSGYLSSTIAVQAGTTNSAGSTSTAGFLFVNGIGASTYVYSGSIVIQNISGNTWVESGVLTDTLAVRASISGGNCTLGGVLDRIRVTTTTGVDTFDAGTINIIYEG